MFRIGPTSLLEKLDFLFLTLSLIRFSLIEIENSSCREKSPRSPKLPPGKSSKYSTLCLTLSGSSTLKLSLVATICFAIPICKCFFMTVSMGLLSNHVS